MRGSVCAGLIWLTLGLTDARSDQLFCGESFATLEALQNAIQAKPNVKELPTDGSVKSYSDAATGTIWNFATTSNPAFPSVVCRSLVQKDGAFSVKTLFRCGAEKAECDRLVASYNDLDRKMREAIEKQKR
ncbi:hypothetical protein [Hyphomicrobium sp.]|uniref:hypothetical protein n=1 Tax=Hyphomicrobium sp. TaxID=82 RepID=UPI003F7030B4